jgi:glutamate dehydrogenase
VVTNSLINRMGATFVHVMKEKTGQSASDIARAYAITRSAFKLRGLWEQIEALDARVDAKAQIDMLVAVSNLADQATLWFLRNGQHPLDSAANVAETGPALSALENALPIIVSPSDQAAIAQQFSELAAQGVPEALAQHIAQLPAMMPSLDIVRIATDLKIKVEEVGQTYFAIGDQFHLDWLRSGAKSLIGDSHWQRLAVFAIIEDLYGHQRELTQVILKGGQDVQEKVTGQPAIDQWKQTRGAALTRAESLFGDLRQVGKLELAMLAVANRTLRSLIA